MESFITAELEIRAPTAHVIAVAGRVSEAAHWLWAPAQVATAASSRDLPDGTRQLIVADGDKLRDKVVDAGDRTVVLESEFRPRREEVQGRKLRYELSVEPGAGTAIAKLGLAFLDRDAPTATAEVRRWRRHAEQCLRRLETLALPEAEAEADAD